MEGPDYLRNIFEDTMKTTEADLVGFEDVEIE